jgi:hypothetical protein
MTTHLKRYVDGFGRRLLWTKGEYETGNLVTAKQELGLAKALLTKVV